jgi:alkylation response protein AidB-like acyl-CoA dehydrogenase
MTGLSRRKFRRKFSRKHHVCREPSEVIDFGHSSAQHASGFGRSQTSRLETTRNWEANGLKFFIVDMASPGFTVKPLSQMSGDAEFNELYFDNLEVPAENVVGRGNGGWAMAITTLMFERGPPALSRQLILRQGIAELPELAQAQCRAADPVMRQRLAQVYIDAEALRYANLRTLTRLIQGKQPGPEGSASKLFFSGTWQRVLELGLEMQGPYAALRQGSPRAVGDGWWQYRALRSRADTIAGGTSEIMKNILAERVLGLQKD